jgi:hypothetical protein
MFFHMSNKTNYYLRRQIIDLGFDDKFIRTWEYYFDYCAAGFKTLTLRSYQVKHTLEHINRNISMSFSSSLILDLL